MCLVYVLCLNFRIFLVLVSVIYIIYINMKSQLFALVLVSVLCMTMVTSDLLDDMLEDEMREAFVRRMLREKRGK